MFGTRSARWRGLWPTRCGAGGRPCSLDRGLLAERVALLAGPASLAAVVDRWGRSHFLPEEDIPAFLVRVERAVDEPIAELDLTRLVAGMDQPSLIVHDRDDKDIPMDDGLAVAAAWQGARLLLDGAIWPPKDSHCSRGYQRGSGVPAQFALRERRSAGLIRPDFSARSHIS